MLLNHHILAKKATDSVLAKFKNGDWTCGDSYGKDFCRTGCDADFPSPDAAFCDTANDLVVSFEFKPPTETKRGILTGLGQAIAYLQFSDLSYLVIPETVEDYNIAAHLGDIFDTIVEDKLPVGLISYKNGVPEDVELAHNVAHLVGHGVKHTKIQNSRFWANYVDLPIPLFHLILHYAYLKKINGSDEDAFAACWRDALAPLENLLKLAPQPFRDVAGQIVMTPRGNKPQVYFEKTVDKIRKLSGAERHAAITEMIKRADPATKGDTMYASVRKNCIPFMHHVGMLDSACELTGDGIKMYHLGISNGPQSRVFRDYFARMVLLEGHHIDLIYDMERLACEFRGQKDDKDLKAIMLDEYTKKGMYKPNPGRKVASNPKTPAESFLKDEVILWKCLDLVRETPGKPTIAFDWQRINEVCNLPPL